eukprot:310104-Pleurochrysis_carterae.AAC.2
MKREPHHLSSLRLLVVDAGFGLWKPPRSRRGWLLNAVSPETVTVRSSGGRDRRRCHLRSVATLPLLTAHGDCGYTSTRTDVVAGAAAPKLRSDLGGDRKRQMTRQTSSGQVAVVISHSQAWEMFSWDWNSAFPLTQRAEHTIAYQARRRRETRRRWDRAAHGGSNAASARPDDIVAEL